MGDSQTAVIRYRAFISYSHRDHGVARWLHRAIEAYRVPASLVGRETAYGAIPRRLSPVFRDEEELAGAAELGPVLEGALRDSAALVVICSPASAGSRWVDHEIRFFKRVDPNRPVLAVIAQGEPGSEHECFPASLRFGVHADGSSDPEVDSEPLAPDLQKQDRDSVKLKLIAGLLGVGYNDLARRDLRRSRQRMAAFGSLAVVIIAALSVLSIAAFSYARMAIEQRNLARKATATAQHNAVEAERRAWLAEVAAQEVRRDADLLAAAPRRGHR